MPQAEESFLFKSKFLGWRHRHTEEWSPHVVAFLEDVSGLNVDNKKFCVSA